MSALDNDNTSLNVTELLLNTTEQILQKVNDLLIEAKEQNNEYNWDPATFAVTLIIGIIATFFAGLAIIQGLLASGPGRLKCGKYAIGPWSQLTTRKFDWSELRFRTVAYTPIISWNAMNSQREKYSQINPLTGRREDSKNSLRKGLDEFFPSSWLALLTCLNADHPELWGRKATGADFVPTELPSVLAYGNLRDVINLALIASEEVIRLEFDADSHLPLVQANDLSLSFRIHPLLGLVGSFEQYKIKCVSKRGRVTALPAAMDLAIGLCHVRTAPFKHALPWRGVRNMEEIEALYGFYHGLAIGRCQCKPNEAVSAETAVPSDGTEALSLILRICGLHDAGIHRMFILCDFEPPSDGPMVFPRGCNSMFDILWPLLLQSNFWLQGVSTCEASRARGLCPQKLTHKNFRTRLMGIIGTREKDLSNTIDATVFSSCCKYLASLSSQPNRDEGTDRALRMLCFDQGKAALNNKLNMKMAQNMLNAEIKRIDSWMSEVNQNAWNCRVRTMSVMAGLTHLALKVAITDDSVSASDVQYLPKAKRVCETKSLEDFLYSCMPEFHRRGVQDALKELQGVWKQVAVSKQLRGLDAKDPLDDLLIYRTILSAMVLEVAADNQAVMNNKAYDRVIPIL